MSSIPPITPPSQKQIQDNTQKKGKWFSTFPFDLISKSAQKTHSFTLGSRNPRNHTASTSIHCNQNRVILFMDTKGYFFSIPNTLKIQELFFLKFDSTQERKRTLFPVKATVEKEEKETTFSFSLESTFGSLNSKYNQIIPIFQDTNESIWLPHRHSFFISTTHATPSISSIFSCISSEATIDSIANEILEYRLSFPSPELLINQENAVVPTRNVSAIKNSITNCCSFELICHSIQATCFVNLSSIDREAILLNEKHETCVLFKEQKQGKKDDYCISFSRNLQSPKLFLYRPISENFIPVKLQSKDGFYSFSLNEISLIQSNSSCDKRVIPVLQNDKEVWVACSHFFFILSNRLKTFKELKEGIYPDVILKPDQTEIDPKAVRKSFLEYQAKSALPSSSRVQGSSSLPSTSTTSSHTATPYPIPSITQTTSQIDSSTVPPPEKRRRRELTIPSIESPEEYWIRNCEEPISQSTPTSVPVASNSDYLESLALTTPNFNWDRPNVSSTSLSADDYLAEKPTVNPFLVNPTTSEYPTQETPSSPSSDLFSL